MLRSKTEKEITVDVSIVGGGLSGGMLAAALDQAGVSTALIDAHPTDALLSDSYDGRTTAIAFACGRLFKRLNLWAPLAPFASPIREILITDGNIATPSRSGGASDHFLRFSAETLDGDEPLGWIIENQRMRRTIIERIEASTSTHILAPTRRLKTSTLGGFSVTELDDGRRVKSYLTVAADGKNSQLASEAGIRSFSWPYDQHAIIATIAHTRSHHGIAQEFFLPSGPFAVLPLTEQRSSIVWTEKASKAQRFLSLSDKDFLRALKARLGDHLGDISLVGPKGSYPVGLSFAYRFYSNRLALVGDAARAIHPIAGQGYNLGLKDIAALTDVISNARSLGQDIGAIDVLQKYDRWRRFDSTGLALGTDALNRLFSNSFPPIRAARRLGLSVVNRLPSMKEFFMRESGADLGDVPTLLQRV
ncbi:MAG: UbiH/UbiF/VisC/COQ6 family ubiquinone biosynthesis hydroxylase [Pseudomonadota bacterium]